MNASYRKSNMEISVINTIETEPKEEILSNDLEPKSSGKCNCRCRFCSRWLPSKRKLLLSITQLLILIFFASALYGILGEDVLPGSEIFALLLLALAAYVGGKIISYIKLPPLLGMLIVGFLYRNISVIPYHNDISLMWSSSLKDIALVIILIRAGLGLDSEKLKKMKMVVFRLSFIPCFVETICTASFTRLFIGLPWIWCVMLGFIVSAVSPAVIVPSMLSLQEKKLGFAKGIPTLVIAAASMDDVIAITGFTVCLSIAFAEGNLVWTIVKGPLEPLVGFAFGAVFGVVIWYLPSKESLKSVVAYYHVLLVTFGGLALMFISKRTGLAGSGPLSVISLAFVAAMRWRMEEEEFEGVEWVMGILWKLIQPFLFGLIGCEVTVESLQTNLGYSVLALLLGILIRLIGTVFVVFGTGLNLKERIFIACAWIAKATVQAAVGSQALDYARAHELGDEIEEYGKQILTMAVLSIIMTAPIGAALIALLSPLLLTKDESLPKSMENNNSTSEDNSSTRVRISQPDYGSCNPVPSLCTEGEKNEV